VNCVIKKFVFSIALFLFLASSMVFANYYGKATYGYGYYGQGVTPVDYGGGSGGGSPAPSGQSNVTNATNDAPDTSSDTSASDGVDSGDAVSDDGSDAVASDQSGTDAPVAGGDGSVEQSQQFGQTFDLGGTSIPIVAIVIVIVIAIVAFFAMRR